MYASTAGLFYLSAQAASAVCQLTPSRFTRSHSRCACLHETIYTVFHISVILSVAPLLDNKHRGLQVWLTHGQVAHFLAPEPDLSRLSPLSPPPLCLLLVWNQVQKSKCWCMLSMLASVFFSLTVECFIPVEMLQSMPFTSFLFLSLHSWFVFQKHFDVRESFLCVCCLCVACLY